MQWHCWTDQASVKGSNGDKRVKSWDSSRFKVLARCKGLSGSSVKELHWRDTQHLRNQNYHFHKRVNTDKRCDMTLRVNSQYIHTQVPLLTLGMRMQGMYYQNQRRITSLNTWRSHSQKRRHFPTRCNLGIMSLLFSSLKHQRQSMLFHGIYPWSTVTEQNGAWEKYPMFCPFEVP